MTNKSTGTAYILLILAGVFGVHRFYLNKPFTGILFLLTFGFGGLGILLDLLMIPSMVEAINGKVEGKPSKTLTESLEEINVKLEAKTKQLEQLNKEAKANLNTQLKDNKKELTNKWSALSTTMKSVVIFNLVAWTSIFIAII